MRVIDRSEVRHAVAEVELTMLRNAQTGTAGFRAALRRLSRILVCEATRELHTEDIPISTPMAPTTGSKLVFDVIVVEVLRAGLGMIDAFMDVIPGAKQGHIGLQRDEATAIASQYYCKFPPHIGPHNPVFLLDPMLATGGSCCDALKLIEATGAEDITVISVIAAQEGVDRVRREFPNVKIFTAAVDPILDERKYIVPGLGDAGDRYCGT